MDEEERIIPQVEGDCHNRPKGHGKTKLAAFSYIIVSARSRGARKQTYTLKLTAGTLNSRLGGITLISDTRGDPNPLTYHCHQGIAKSRLWQS